ncbi:M23 family metallopeptidase [Schleiferiaceae bacterium]|nr:M23 family metallopeptidase [Schleiferiaceae bacterium]
MKRIFFFVFSLSFAPLGAQPYIAVQPLAGPVDFAGTFGELRNHHFHSGVDFRTGGRTGMPVRAVADGYLSRIVVRPDGFGWALYLSHPSGYTSVYAHLDDFQPAWNQLALDRARRSQTHKLDLYLEPGAYPVRAGDTIAWSGNSGGSAGPHLHFEWRDARSEEPLNPFEYGLFYGEDTYSPRLISIYNAEGKRAVISNGRWQESIALSAWPDLGIEFLDRKHPQGLSLGMQRLETEWIYMEDTSQVGNLGWEMKRFSFDETRSADGHMQPEVKRLTSKRTYRIAPSLAKSPKWTGSAPDYSRTGRYYLRLRATAANGEVVTAEGPVILTNRDSPWKGGVGVLAGDAGQLTTEHMELRWAKASFTEAFSPELVEVDASHWKGLPDVPVLQSLDYTWTPPADYPAAWRSKTVLIGRDARGSYRIVGEARNDGRIHFRIKIFGDLRISHDLEAPKMSSFGTSAFQGKAAWSLRLEDNLLDIVDYDVWINDQWQWAYYDAKNKRLHIPKSEDLSELHGANMRVRAKDEAGNLSTFDIIIP